MIKIILMIVIGLGIYGYVSGTIKYVDENGAINISIDKSKIMDSVKDGSKKAMDKFEEAYPDKDEKK